MKGLVIVGHVVQVDDAALLVRDPEILDVPGEPVHVALPTARS